MNKKAIISMAVVVGSTSLLFTAVYILQYYQSQLSPVLKIIPPETAISIAANEQNLTQFDINDFTAGYVYIKSNGQVYNSNIISKSIGDYIWTADSTVTGTNHYVWEVKNNKNNFTYFIDSISGEIIAISN